MENRPNPLLKGDVVIRDALVHVVRRRRGRGGLRRALRGAGHRNRAFEIAAAGSGAGVSAAAEQDQLVCDHFRNISLLVVLIFVAAALQAAFYPNLLPFQEVIRQVFRSPQDYVVPVGLFLPLARRLVFPAPVGGDGEGGTG